MRSDGQTHSLSCCWWTWWWVLAADGCRERIGGIPGGYCYAYEIAIRDKYGDNVIEEDLEHHALQRPTDTLDGSDTGTQY